MMRVFTSCATLAVALMVGACESRPAAEQAAATTATTAAPAADSTAAPAVTTAAYICPMGCEGSASSKPGKCPVCQMELEANPAAAAEKPASAL